MNTMALPAQCIDGVVSSNFGLASSEGEKLINTILDIYEGLRTESQVA